MTFEIIARQIVIKKRNNTTLKNSVPQQKVESRKPQTNLKGLVLDESGIPLAGASVIAKGTSVGTTTDFDGNFEITMPIGTTIIQVSNTFWVQLFSHNAHLQDRAGKTPTFLLTLLFNQKTLLLLNDTRTVPCKLKN
ncbi:carboxypeptidase regulatory-like domain-containing protein [Flagellimonas ruestringensis]|uniref:carboxypeptidase regulatory-like domain-containing protein n=1 Tax=Flagellimonas ruestringensis TaxID=111501 RepID=UPI0002E34B0C|nr:carboxypeptidase regulatory-like domain-containing protein [Allomuricauda ruestringensis]